MKTITRRRNGCEYTPEIFPEEEVVVVARGHHAPRENGVLADQPTGVVHAHLHEEEWDSGCVGIQKCWTQICIHSLLCVGVFSARHWGLQAQIQSVATNAEFETV